MSELDLKFFYHDAKVNKKSDSFFHCKKKDKVFLYFFYLILPRTKICSNLICVPRNF